MDHNGNVHLYATKHCQLIHVGVLYIIYICIRLFYRFNVHAKRLCPVQNSNTYYYSGLLLQWLQENRVITCFIPRRSCVWSRQQHEVRKQLRTITKCVKTFIYRYIDSLKNLFRIKVKVLIYVYSVHGVHHWQDVMNVFQM